MRTLLERGYLVRGTVRDSSNETKTTWIKNLVNNSFFRVFYCSLITCGYFKANGLPGTLELVTVNLLDEESLINAFEGAHYLIHTAAVIRMVAKDPKKDIIDPSVVGTSNVFSAVKKVKSIR